MANITFVEPDGTSVTIAVPAGTSLMQGAVNHNIRGIDADCGGSITCGTCMISVAPEWREKIGASSELERQILEFCEDPGGNVRLSCQIIASEELDGMCVHVPKTQAMA